MEDTPSGLRQEKGEARGGSSPSSLLMAGCLGRETTSWGGISTQNSRQLHGYWWFGVLLQEPLDVSEVWGSQPSNWVPQGRMALERNLGTCRAANYPLPLSPVQEFLVLPRTAPGDRRTFTWAWSLVHHVSVAWAGRQGRHGP